jgi:hypothetical protein
MKLATVMLRLKDGTGLFANQFVGLPTLPRRIEPTESYLMPYDPMELARTLGNRSTSLVHKVYCMDEAEQKYERRLTKRERYEITAAVEFVRPAEIKAG